MPLQIPQNPGLSLSEQLSTTQRLNRQRKPETTYILEAGNIF